MSVRLVVVVSLLLSYYAPGQQTVPSGGETEPIAPVAANAGATFKQQLMHRIAIEEEEIRQKEAAHVGRVELSKAYEQLGLSYQCAAAWERSEAALQRAVSLLEQPL